MKESVTMEAASLQPDLMRHVLSFFIRKSHQDDVAIADTDSLVNAALTCRSWKRAVYDARLWRNHNETFHPGTSFLNASNNETLQLVGFVKVLPQHVYPTVRELASNVEFRFEDFALHTQKEANMNPKAVRKIRHWFQEMFIYGYCYGWRCSSYRDLWKLAQKEKLLQVPYMRLQLTLPGKPPFNMLFRQIYLETDGQSTPNIFNDSYEGHQSVLLRLNQHRKAATDDTYKAIMDHYNLIESSRPRVTISIQEYGEIWYKLMDWVCEMVTVLGWKKVVSARVAVSLKAILSELPRTSAQSITASLVVISHLILGEKSIEKVIEDLSFSADKRWSPEVIWKTAFILAMKNTSAKTPICSPVMCATPTLLHWVYLYSLKHFMELEKALSKMFQFAESLAFLLLPSPLYLEACERQLAACCVVLARWAHYQKKRPQTGSLSALFQDDAKISWKDDLDNLLPRVVDTIHRQRQLSFAPTKLSYKIPRHWPPP